MVAGVQPASTVAIKDAKVNTIVTITKQVVRVCLVVNLLLILSFIPAWLICVNDCSFW